MVEWIAEYWLQTLFTGALGALSVGVKVLWAKMKQQELERQALKAGVIAMLHDRLFQSCNYFLDRGYVPLNQAEEICDNMKIIYDAYHGIGGNGTGSQIYERFRKLPWKNKKEDENYEIERQDL